MFQKTKSVDEFKKFQTSNFVIQHSTNWEIDDEIIDLGANPGIFLSFFLPPLQY